LSATFRERVTAMPAKDSIRPKFDGNAIIAFRGEVDMSGA
jgi:hypothetical protein